MGSNSGACYTTAAIPPSTRLLSIPHSLAITYSNTISQFPSELSEDGTPVGHYAIISAFLALEKLKGTESFWHPYIATLPPVELGCGGPLFQSPEIIHQWLEGTNLSVQEVENVKEDWRQDWKCIKEVLGSIEGWKTHAESLTWYAGIPIVLRYFGAKAIGLKGVIPMGSVDVRLASVSG